MATYTEEISVAGGKLKATLKNILREGNVRRIMIQNSSGRTLLDLPLTAGVVGAKWSSKRTADTCDWTISAIVNDGPYKQMTVRGMKRLLLFLAAGALEAYNIETQEPLNGTEARLLPETNIRRRYGPAIRLAKKAPMPPPRSIAMAM